MTGIGLGITGIGLGMTGIGLGMTGTLGTTGIVLGHGITLSHVENLAWSCLSKSVLKPDQGGAR
jgi:hypothetical protein